MRHTAIVVALAIAGCSSLREPPALYGLLDAKVIERGGPDVIERMSTWSRPDTDCAAGVGLQLRADVAGSADEETILASYTQGVIVLDREGAVIASTPGYPCEGPADAIEMLAAGHAFLESERTIAMTVISGGRREQMTSLAQRHARGTTARARAGELPAGRRLNGARSAWRGRRR